MTYQPTVDLAGEACFRPNFFQTKSRVNHLREAYLNLATLDEHLTDLPQQFKDPRPRPWSTINWQTINPAQVIGLELDIFLSIIKGALDTEAPIRGYTQASRQYLEPIHPSMARFVGGTVSSDGVIIELGLWEKEERQHTPALSKLYQLLSGGKLVPTERSTKNYQPQTSPYQDLFRHGLHRIATEYGAVCLYLWLMSHTTGTTQQVLGELLQDEINHLTKFWGMGRWLYPDSQQQLLSYLLRQIPTISLVSSRGTAKFQSSLPSTFQRMMSVLNWQSWPILSQVELIYTFTVIWQRMWQWNSQLSPEHLHDCCATPDFFGHNSDAEWRRPVLVYF